jgi:hypothetical protein
MSGGGGGSDILRNYEQQFGILCADITSNSLYLNHKIRIANC